MSRILSRPWTGFLSLRNWVLATVAATALVVLALGTAAFAAVVAAIAGGAPLTERAMSVNGAVTYPVRQLTDLHLDSSTAQLLALAAVVTLGLGALLLCVWVALGLSLVAAQLRRGDA